MGENPEKNLEALLASFGDNTPADYIDEEEAVKATLKWVRKKQANGGKIPQVVISVKKLFGFFKKLHKEQKQDEDKDKGQDQKKTTSQTKQEGISGS